MDQLCSHPEAEHVNDVSLSATHCMAGHLDKNSRAHSKDGIAHPSFEKASLSSRPSDWILKAVCSWLHCASIIGCV